MSLLKTEKFFGYARVDWYSRCPSDLRPNGEHDWGFSRNMKDGRTRYSCPFCHSFTYRRN